MRNGRIHKSVMGAGDIFSKVSPLKSLLPRLLARASDDEIVIFDSTGTGLQDVAAAIATYRQALYSHAGTQFTFS